jgi:WD40 repeat protein/serine/threonine protein kinase
MGPQSIDRIFWDAAHLASAGERDAYLDGACGGDAELRRRLEQLLEARAKADNFLEQPAPALATTADEPAGERAGAAVGPYQLVERLGEGGMGTVWLAQQQEPVKRLVALKLIKAGLDTAQVVARFEAERQALALMDHPNIARVLDGGADGSGRPYFVMELVKGVPITDYCDRNHLTPRQRLELFAQVCAAVQHAHQKGVIHRDLKPSNVLVASCDGRPVVKVIDFGVAKAAGQPLTERTLVTGLGALVGTLEYMSPEQAHLNSQDVDTRSDVYSLGVILYELLTGSTPLGRQRGKEGGFLEALRIIREEETPRPSARLSTAEDLPTIAACRGVGPGRLSGLLKGELDWIALKALDKDRNRRYESPSAFAADVRRYLNDEPVLACPPSAAYRARKFVQRNRGRVVAAGLMSVALLGGVIGAAFGLVEARNQRTVTSLWHQAEGARAEAETAQAEAEAARDLAQKAERQAQAARKRLAAVEYGRTVDLAYREWANDQIARARALLAGAPKALRGWEWDYVHRLCHAEAATYRLGPPVALSDDGRRAVTVPKKGTYAVWALDGPREVARFPHAAFLKWSPDGRFVAPGPDKPLRLRDPVSGHASPPLPLFGDGLHAPCFSLDGRRALAQTADRRGARVVDTETGAEVLRLGPRPGGLPSPLALSPDGTRAFIQWGPEKYSVVRTDGGKELFSLPLSRVSISKAAFNRSGKLLATAAFLESAVRVWAEPSGAEVLTVPVGASCLAFDRRGRLVIGTGTGGALIWDVAAKRQVGLVKGHTGAVTLLGFPSDGRLVTGSSDGTIRVWRLEEAQPTRVFAAGLGATTSLSFSPDGARLITGLRDRTARVWGLATGKQVLTLPGHPEPTVWSLSVRPDGRQVATVSVPLIKIWDGANGRELTALRPPKGPSERGVFESVAYSPDGQRLVTCGGATARVWDASRGRELFALTGDGGYLRRAVWAPDGAQIAAAGWNGAVHFWDVATRQRRLTLRGHSTTFSVAFSPDGRRLLSAGWGKAAAKVWDCRTGAELFALEGHRVGANAAAFSPDGRRVATAGYDGVLKVWDAASGVELLSISGFPDQLFCAQFSPEGRRLAVGCLQGGTTVLDATPVERTAPPPKNG